MTVPFIVGVWCTEFESHFTMLPVRYRGPLKYLAWNMTNILTEGMRISHIFVTLKLHL